MYYIFIENGKINGTGEVIQPDDNIQNIEISEEIYNKFNEDSRYYIYQNGKIIENPNYENLIKEENILKSIAEIQEKLDTLDTKRIRAVCEDEIKDEKTGETWLDYYNSMIYDLRIELKSLQMQL